MQILKPFMAALGFFVIVYSVSYFLEPTAGVPSTLPGGPAVSHLVFFLTAPFNINQENALTNLYIPTPLIFLIAFYLKNFNPAFQKKSSVRWIFLSGVLASYIEGLAGLGYYHAISTGTSIIVLSFLVALVISFEVYIKEKERYKHAYGRALVRFLTADVIVVLTLTVFAFFVGTSSFLVHLIGLLAFVFLFVLRYEEENIIRFFKKEKTRLKYVERTTINMLLLLFT